MKIINDNKKRVALSGKYAIVTIVMLIVICVLFVLLVRQYTAPAVVLNPDYPPQELEKNAERIPGESGEKLKTSKGGGAVSLRFTSSVSIDLSEQTASLSFANPSSSTQDMMLELVIQDQVIAQSGRLVPGYRIDTLELIEGAYAMLIEGTYDGKFVIHYYDPETNVKAMIQTESPVTVAVRP